MKESSFFNQGGRTLSRCACQSSNVKYSASQQVIPSANSALRLMQGESGALLHVGRDWLVRGAIIGTGLYLAGTREGLVKKSLFASGAIELVVLGCAAWKTRKGF